MKKGDIVKVKPEDREWIEYQFQYKTGSKFMHDFLTLKSAPTTIVGCGPDSLFVQFEETGSYIAYEGYFEVVLKAGEPNVNKLMEEPVMAVVA